MSTSGRLVLLFFGLYAVSTVSATAGFGPVLRKSLSSASQKFKTLLSSKSDKDRPKYICETIINAASFDSYSEDIMEACITKVSALVKDVGYDYIQVCLEIYNQTEIPVETFIEDIKKYHKNNWKAETIEKLKYYIREDNARKAYIFRDVSQYESYEWWSSLLELPERDMFGTSDELWTILGHDGLKKSVPKYVFWKKRQPDRFCDTKQILILLELDHIRKGDILTSERLDSLFDIICKPNNDYQKGWTEMSLRWVLLEDSSPFFTKQCSLEDLQLALEHLPYIASALVREEVPPVVKADWFVGRILEVVKKNTNKEQFLKAIINGMRSAIVMNMSRAAFNNVIAELKSRSVEYVTILHFLHALHKTEMKFKFESDVKEVASLAFKLFELNKSIALKSNKQVPVAMEEVEPLTKDIVNACARREFTPHFVISLLSMSAANEVPEQDIVPFLTAVKGIEDNDKILNVQSVFATLKPSLGDLSKIWERVVKHNEENRLQQIDMHAFVELINITKINYTVEEYFKGGEVLYCETNLMLAIGKFILKMKDTITAAQYRDEIEYACKRLKEFLPLKKRIQNYEMMLAEPNA